MKIPATITILGRKFTVKNDLSDSQMAKMVDDGSCPMGAMNYSLRIIAIKEHKNKEEQFVTFFHECLHAMQYIVGLNQITNPDVAEVWCESGANAIYDMVRAMK